MKHKVKHLIAVDGGGSGCRVRLSDISGKILAEYSGKPSNIATDFALALNNIQEAIIACYKKAGLDPNQRHNDAAWLGLAGAGVGDLAKKVERALAFRLCRVSTDYKTAIQGALGKGDGTLAMLGTGSFFVRRKNGVDKKIGGWGYQLGDEAGGAWLGRELLRAVLRAQDGLEPHSELTRAILKEFDLRPDNIVNFANQASPGEMAKFAPKLIAKMDNDPVASNILMRGCNLICQNLYSLDVENSQALFLLGGLGETYRALLPEKLARLYHRPHGDALDGAMYLARSEFGIKGKCDDEYSRNI